LQYCFLKLFLRLLIKPYIFIMKKIFLFLAIASTTMFVSCSDDDSAAAAATSITLTASSTTVTLGQSVNLTVADNLGADVTATSTFFNGTASITAAFTPTAPGTYTLTAKNGTLTSAAVVVTVNVAQNTIFANGTSYVTNKSIMSYLGSTPEGNNVFIANTYNEVGDPATYPNDVYVLFTASQEAGSTTLTLPSLRSYAFGLPTAANVSVDAQVLVNSAEILAPEVTTDITWTLTAISATATAQSWAYNYGIKLANGSYVYGSYSGDFGFDNQAAKGSKSADMKVVTVTPAELQANLKAVLAKNKR
jgi:hypothetical protein